MEDNDVNDSPPPPPLRALTFRYLRLVHKQHPQTEEDQLRARRQTAECSDLYARAGRVLLASTVPRTMTYWVVPNVDWALRMVANAPQGDQQYFYMVESDRPVTLYADFDAPRKQFASYGEFRSAVCLCVAYLCRFLDITCGVNLALRHYDGEWRLFEACSTSKWSIHAHCRLGFRNVALLHTLVTRFLALLSGSAMRHHDPRVAQLFYLKRGKKTGAMEPHCIMDATVYNARPFRLPHCRKTVSSSNYLRPLLPEKAGMRADIRWGFVHEQVAADQRLVLDAPINVGEVIRAVLERPLRDWQVLSDDTNNIMLSIAIALNVALPDYALQRCTQQPPDGVDADAALQLLRDSRALRRSWALAVAYQLRWCMLDSDEFLSEQWLPLVATVGFQHVLEPLDVCISSAASALGLEMLSDGGVADCAVVDEQQRDGGARLTLPEIAALLLIGARFDPDSAESDFAATERLCDFARLQSTRSVLPAVAQQPLLKDLVQFAGVLPTELQPLGATRFLPVPNFVKLRQTAAQFSFIPRLVQSSPQPLPALPKKSDSTAPPPPPKHINGTRTTTAPSSSSNGTRK